MLSGGLDARGATSSPWSDDLARPDAVAVDADLHTDVHTDPDPSAPVDWLTIVGLGVLLAAGGLWARSLSAVEPRAMGELGLIGLVPVSFLVVVMLLTAGFVVLSARPAGHQVLLTLYLGGFVVVAHITPLIVAGALGNAWAWANVGVVDAVQRTGELPAVAGSLAAPTEWPGLYGGTALLAEITGLDPTTIAMWAPAALTILALASLRVLLRSITADERVIWSAMWLYVVGAWVSQDHLAPLGLSVALALALLAVALPLDRRAGRDPLLAHNIGPADDTVAGLAAAVAFIGIVALAVVATHPVTSVVVGATCAVAAATKASRTLWLAIAVAAASLIWILGPAWSSVGDDLLGWLAPLGAPAQFATTTTLGLSGLTVGAQVVIIAGRFVAQGLVLLAVVGLLMRRRRRLRVGFLLAAMAVPLGLLAAEPGTEPALRSFLYALPWLAFAGAYAITRHGGRRPAEFLALRATVVGALTVGFVIAESGERGAAYFSTGEVELAAWLADAAPADTLLIEGTPNHAFGARHPERFVRATLSEESPAAIARLADDPVGVLAERLAGAQADEFAAAFVVLTRSQELGEVIAPRLPDGLLAEIDAGLRASDRFTIVGQSADAVVFGLAGGGS